MRWIAAALALATFACSSTPPPPNVDDSPLRSLAHEILQDHYTRHPSQATDLGLHQFDAQLEDASEAAVHAESQALQQFKRRLDAISAGSLTVEAQLDQALLRTSLDAGIIALDRIRQWAKDPDSYSSAITNAAYVIMKRPYAPAADRLKALVAREKQMPGTLQEARKNLQTPPRIYTEIAIEQVDGNIRFFTNDLPAAFADVTDTALLDEFHRTNAAVVSALGDYKTYLQQTLLPKSTGSFAFGADTFRAALAANEMIDMAPADLLAIAE